MLGSMTTGLTPPLLQPEPSNAASALTQLGFLAFSDMPDGPGPAYLLVALRSAPTLRHFDPEAIEYWTLDGSRGVRRTLTRASAMPLRGPFAWGEVEIVDRLQVGNEYVTFGGTLWADMVASEVVAVFASPAPILRRGGHSQVVDPGADVVGAHFARVRAAISANPGLEPDVAAAGPVVAYAAFLSDTVARYGACEPLRVHDAQLWAGLCGAARRLRSSQPDAWRAGEALRHRLGI